MTISLLHISSKELFRELRLILNDKGYRISFQNPNCTMMIGYSDSEQLKMVQINIHSFTGYLEVTIHSTCYSPGTFLLTNNSTEEELIIHEIELALNNSYNTFRLMPEDYALYYH